MEGDENYRTGGIDVIETVRIVDGEAAETWLPHAYRSQLRHLRLCVNRSFDNIPQNHYLITITHLFLDFSDTRSDERAGSVYLPCLKDLALLGNAPIKHFEAPRLIILRLFDPSATAVVLKQRPMFPSIEILHFCTGVRVCYVETHIGQLPKLTKIGVLILMPKGKLEREEKIENATMNEGIKRIIEKGVPLKVYPRPRENDYWRFDCNSYERNEISLTI
jgi:hypothetical protein